MERSAIRTPDPAYRERVAAIFSAARFISELGVALGDCGPGWCTSTLEAAERHLQQDGFVHAGVLATMADHTAGAAAGTLLRPDQIVLSVEFKIHLLRPARDRWLHCRAEVLRPGSRIVAVEATIHSHTDPERAASGRRVAKLTATMALTESPKREPV